MLERFLLASTVTFLLCLSSRLGQTPVTPIQPPQLMRHATPESLAKKALENTLCKIRANRYCHTNSS